jgi:hypothetical protein
MLVTSWIDARRLLRQAAPFWHATARIKAPRTVGIRNGNASVERWPLFEESFDVAFNPEHELAG